MSHKGIMSCGNFVPWNWCFVSANPNITPEIIEANPNINWSWLYISLNPNLTPHYLTKWEKQLTKSQLSLNYFDGPYWKSDKHKKYLATTLAKAIYFELMEVAMNPNRNLLSWMSIQDLRRLHEHIGE